MNHGMLSPWKFHRIFGVRLMQIENIRSGSIVLIQNDQK
jgi:hypothetical protein